MTTAHEEDINAVYDRTFYANQIEGSARSTAAVVPRILALFPWVRSVVDVGCGTGVWLHQFRLLGVERVLGLDGGDAMGDLLQIEQAHFRRADLSQPFALEERFDLALSLEVAEHLPPASAAAFVASITWLSDVVVFSAAIPGQGGTQHVHERWPSYWAALFEKQGFVCFDVLRRDLWYDERVEWWYRQNLLVFVRGERTDLTAKLGAESAARRAPLDVVHPVCFGTYRGMAEIVNPGQPVGLASTASLQAEVLHLRTTIETMQSSTSWRALTALHRRLEPRPRLLRFLQRAMKVAWWTVTLQLFARLRERARRRARTG